MKKTFIVLAFLGGITLAFAQVNTGILPLSFQKGILTKEEFQKVQITPPVLTKIDQEDEAAAKNGTFLSIAKLMPVNLSIENSGTWSIANNGRSVWKLGLSSVGAQGCVIHFDRFELPEGSQLFVYNPDGSVILGPFTSADNPERLSYSIGMIYGNEAILEYIAPLSKIANGVTYSIKPKLEISRFAYVFRDVIDLRSTNDYGNSESCQVNVNCSEGDNWREQQKGVARIYVVEGNTAGWCSGTLINNVKNDGTPYFLTADHCGGENGTFAEWSFYFNYESAGCSKASPTTTQIITGCTRKARTPLNGASDFLLLELSTTADQIEEIGGVYNGWNNATTASPSGVSIHHPAGDIKKISTYTKTLTSATYYDSDATGATNAHWEVYWTATTNGHGTTEGGSSGSPIFDNNGYVVGTLSGGTSSCSAKTESDLYGKVAVHWATKSAADAQLKHWLDPDNSGATTCNYYDPAVGFKVKPSNLKFSKNADSQTVAIQAGSSSANWTATSNSDWLSITPTTGSGSGKTTQATVLVTNNQGDYKRTGTITVTHNGEEQTISVSQSGVIVYGFSYDFEECNDFAVDSFPPCTTYDGDKLSTYTITGTTFKNQGYTGSYIAFNPTQTSPSLSDDAAIAPYSGNKFGACFASENGDNNDWFITPLIKLGTNSKFTFMAKSYTTDYGKENFNVLISTTDNQPTSFTALGSTVSVPAAWTAYPYNLAAYDNQSVYLAIQCTSSDRFIFMIDDLEVTTEEPVSVNLLTEDNTNWNIFAKNGVLFVDAAANTIEIFNIMGQKIYSQKGENGIMSINNLPQSQVLVVRCGNKVKRVIL